MHLSSDFTPMITITVSKLQPTGPYEVKAVGLFRGRVVRYKLSDAVLDVEKWLEDLAAAYGDGDRDQ